MEDKCLVLSGSISACETLSGSISEAAIGGDAYPPYQGDYVVTPAANDEQTLETKGKYMKDDVIVKEIPYAETSNASDGITVYIGAERMIEYA